MKIRSSKFGRSALYVAMSAIVLPPQALGSPLALSTAPAGTSYKAPVPNVIVSVDDSGSMGTSGMASLREALRQTFTQGNVPDEAIRLAWQAMTNCYQIPSVDCSNKNVMKVLDTTHRANFMAWVETLTPKSGTPSHRMLRNAGEYLRSPVDINSAWASVPGTTLAPVLGCRRAYNLFMTDGGWNALTLPADNSRGDADHTAITLPDGTAYDITSDNTRIYRSAATGSFSGSSVSTTLSDLAFHYWATDLQPGMTNNVKPKIKQPGSATFTNAGTSKTIAEYWNPRNDPATWQHMTTYAVGFNGAANWAVNPRFGSDTWTGGAYPALITGNQTWPNPITGSEDNERITELWHMSLNSRGKFIPAPTAASLSTAFKDILNEIIVDNSAPLTSLAASARTTRQDSAILAAGYNATDWSGQVTAYKVSAGTAAVDAGGLWGTIAGSSPAKPVSTASLMDAANFDPASRLVLSAQVATGGTAVGGVDWQWANLSAAKKLELNTVDGVVDALGEARLNFVRGDRSREQNQTPAGPFRTRGSRHGDIVNSKVWHLAGKPDSGYGIQNYASFRTTQAARAAMLYVGANDGMLHGFNAATGQEKIAYIPDGLSTRLSRLTRPNYAHAYYVDGSPFTADLYTGSAWKTYLAGFPGAGGKGYFVLDVTDPSTTGFAAANASSLVVLDRTATSDADVGHIVADPVTDQTNDKIALQITRMNNGRWALVTGNGYNSASEKAVLLIQYLDGAKELLKLTADATGANGNGLSAPRLVDLNGDRIPDVAYAGDLLGNLWKFDLSDPSAANWNVAFSGTPLYVARDAAAPAARQPITSAPAWLFHPGGGLMVTFATGRNLTDADRATTQRQTIYGIYDKTAITVSSAINTATQSGTVALDSANNAVSTGRTDLVEQTIGSTSTATSAEGNELWTVSSNSVSYSGAHARKGWYLDLPISGERVTGNMQWSGGRLMTVPTYVPAQGGDTTKETCDPTSIAGKSTLTTLNAITGAAPSYAVYGYANGFAPTAGAGNPSRGTDPTRGIHVRLTGPGFPSDTKCVAAPGQRCDGLPPPPSMLLQPTWRQAQ